MHGIDAFLARAGRDVPGHETSGLARRLGRDLLEHIRGCIETLDQRAELILDAGHAGKLRLGAAKLLTHLGKLLLDGSEIVELWRLPERFAQLVCDLVEACVHRLDRRRGHDRAERMFELMGHVGQALVEGRREIERGRREWKIGCLETEVREPKGRWLLRPERSRGGWKGARHIGRAGQPIRPASREVEIGRELLAEPLEIIERIRALRLEAPRKAVHLIMQPIERRRTFRCAGRPYGVGGLRELIEPCVQLIERLAVAALAFLDPLDEPAEQALNRALVHGAVGRRRAGPVRATGLPSCFRSHPVPHECDAAEPVRVRSGVGLKGKRDTRRSARN